MADTFVAVAMGDFKWTLVHWCMLFCHPLPLFKNMFTRVTWWWPHIHKKKSTFAYFSNWAQYSNILENSVVFYCSTTFGHRLNWCPNGGVVVHPVFHNTLMAYDGEWTILPCKQMAAILTLALIQDRGISSFRVMFSVTLLPYHVCFFMYISQRGFTFLT